MTGIFRPHVWERRYIAPRDPVSIAMVAMTAVSTIAGVAGKAQEGQQALQAQQLDQQLQYQRAQQEKDYATAQAAITADKNTRRPRPDRGSLWGCGCGPEPGNSPGGDVGFSGPR